VCLQEERRGASWPAAREEMLGQNFIEETNLTIPEPLTPFPSTAKTTAEKSCHS